MKGLLIKKYLLPLGIVSAFSLFFTNSAKAVCPVCTIAVGSALVLLERYGVDNTISGIWIGALLISTSLWTINWLKKKDWYSRGTGIMVFIFFYLSVISPLYLKGMIGAQDKEIWGIDKIVLGLFIGTLFFYLGNMLYVYIKRKNNNKPWFPFQRVVMPLLSLALITVIFYFITKQ